MTATACLSQSEVLLEQLGGAGRLQAMTGAQLVLGTEAACVCLVFPRQVGPSRKRLTHLWVALDQASDLYVLTGYRLNRRTCALQEQVRIEAVAVSELIRTCEELTGLAFRL